MPAETLDVSEYRLLETRPRVLVQSLVKSRDNWKQRCQESVANGKKLRDRIRDLEASRAKWRDDAEAAVSDLQRLQREVEMLELQLAQSAAEIATQESESKKTAN